MGWSRSGGYGRQPMPSVLMPSGPRGRGVAPADYFYGSGPQYPPSRGAYDRVMPEVANFNLGVQSQVAISVVPGQLVLAYHVEFDYAGPARRIGVGWALKPSAPGIFDPGTNWNNGGSTIPGRWGSNYFSVPASANFAPVSKDINIGIVVPAPGTYTLMNGESGKINSGKCTTWAWITDYDRVAAAGATPAAWMSEEFLFVIDSANTPVLDISGASGVQNLNLQARAY